MPGAALGRLKDYLSGDGPCVPLDCQSLGEGARALIAGAWDNIDRAAARSVFSHAPGDGLPARVDWFYRLLCLLPQPEREAWMQRQVTQAEVHALAATGLRHRLDPLLFDAHLPHTVQYRLWAIWLATAGPGPIMLDALAREARLASAERLIDQALQGQPGPF